MYIKLTERIINLALSDNEGSDSARELLYYLDIAIRLGKHFVFCSYEVLTLLSNLQESYKGLKGLHEMFAEYGAIASTFDWHAEFILDGDSYKDENRHIIFINYKNVPSFELYVETRLICEHLNDAVVYNLILTEYKNKHGLEIDSNFYPMLGGGSTTAIVYEHEIKEAKTFILCLSDSDFKFNDSALGDTARNIKSIDNKYKSFNSYYYHLTQLSESENIIPLTVYRQYVDNNNDDGMKEICKVFEKIKGTDSRYLCYLDFKKGITLHRLQNIKENDNIKDIAAIVVEDVDSYIGEKTLQIQKEISHIDDIQLREEQFKLQCKKNQLLRGFGDNILDNVLKFIKKQNVTDVFHDATDSQLYEIEQIGKLLYDWSAAMKPIKS